MEFNFIPSTYQQKIFDFFATGVGNAVINAKAGSSKTTTAVKALDYIPSEKKVLFLAFNKSIANELAERIQDKPNVYAWTFHALGYRIIREKYPNITLDAFKYKTFINKNLPKLRDNKDYLSPEDYERYKKNCEELTDLSRYNKCQSEAEIGRVAEKYGILCVDDEVSTVEKILAWGKQNISTIDYTDMEWLPYELGLGTKKFKFDWIIIDEAQDTSPIRQELFRKCLRRGTRFVAIGDKDQTINAWCGSDESAFENFLKESNTIQLDLPICYRCPTAVIKKLQTLVPDIQAAPNAIEGKVNYDVSIFDAKPGDMVLCRNSAPLSVLYADYIKKNINAYIKGGDIGNNLNALMDSTNSTTLSFDFSVDGVIPRLYKSLLKSLRKSVETEGLAFEDAIQTEKFMKLYDSIKTIEILGNGTTDLMYLKSRINKIYTDSNGPGICLSTVHKAKGLEADNIFIVCPSLMPSPLATKPWEIEAEQHIQYVAWSRAKKTLNFVDEKIFSPQRCYMDLGSVKNEILDAAEKLRNLYHKDYLNFKNVMVDNIFAKKTNTSKAINTNNSQQPKKKIGVNKFKSFLKK